MNFKINILCKDNILLKKYIFCIKIFEFNIEIYYNHTPILLFLDKSIILLNDVTKYSYFICSGLLEFSNNKLNIISDELITYKDLNKNQIFLKIENIKNKIILLKDKFSNKYLNLLYKLNIYKRYLKLIKFAKFK